jgi:hypothetical protein
VAFSTNPVYGGYGVAQMQRMQPMQPQQFGGYNTYQTSAQGMWNYSSNFTQNTPNFGGPQFDSAAYGASPSYGGSYGFPQPAQFGNSYMDQGMFPQASNFGNQQYGSMFLPPSTPQAGGNFGGYGADGLPSIPSMDQIAQLAARDLGINPASSIPFGQMPSQDQLVQMVIEQQNAFNNAAANQAGGQGGQGNGSQVPPFNGVGMPTMDQMAQMAADKIKAFNDAVEKADPGAAEREKAAAKAQEDAFFDRLGAAIAKAISAGQTPAGGATPAAATTA